FQAEDGIRDLYVTGVQTCALPIYRRHRPCSKHPASTNTGPSLGRRRVLRAGSMAPVVMTVASRPVLGGPACQSPSGTLSGNLSQIGRASCRESVESASGDDAVKNR